jgi:FkbM family methyltransferase
MSQDHPVARLQWVENALFLLLSRELPTRCMIDVGAHHGLTLEPFLEAGWRVDAFEPVEANRQVLAARCAGKGELHIHAEAVSDRSGPRPLRLAVRPDGSLHDYYHTLENVCVDEWHRKGPIVEVGAVSLDDLVARGDVPGRVGLLKVDTEGHDLAVLRGAGRLRCEAVSVEFWREGVALGPPPSPAEDMVELLRSRDFDSYLALVHCGGAITVRDSSLTGLPRDAWGNLVFFHHAVRSTYEQLRTRRDWLLVLEMAAEVAAASAAATERMEEITRLARALRQRDDLIAEIDREARRRADLIAEIDREARRRAEMIQWQEQELERRAAFIQALEAQLRQNATQNRLRRVLGRIFRRAG